MSQVTVYMNPDLVKRMKAAAAAEGMSVSAWLAQLVRERIEPTWPPEVVVLAGAWDEFPSADELRASPAPMHVRLG